MRARSIVLGLLLVVGSAAQAAEPLTVDRLLAEVAPVPERIEWDGDGNGLRVFSGALAAGKPNAFHVGLAGSVARPIPFRAASVRDATQRSVELRRVAGTAAKPVAAKARPEPAVPLTVVGGDAPPGGQTHTFVEQRRGRQTDRWDVPGKIVGWNRGPGDSLYVTVWPGFEADDPNLATRVVRLDPGAQVTEIFRTPGVMQGMRPVPSPDGQRMALAYDSYDNRWDDYNALNVLDLANDQVQRLDAAGSVASEYEWSSNDEIVYIQRAGGFNHLSRIRADGSGAERLTEGAHRVHGMSLSPDRTRVAFLTEDGYGRRDVRVLDLNTRAVRIVHVVTDPSARLHLGEFRRISWQARDGLKLYGFLVLPPDFNPARRHGMVVDVHGGGPGSALYMTAPLMMGLMQGPLGWHYLAAQGWVVFVPDYRSAGEYGPGIAAARYASGDISGIQADADDVADGIRSLLGESWLDPARVVGFGHSAGGPRVHSLLLRTDLLRAAILNESIGVGATSYFLRLTTGASAGQRFEARMRTAVGASFRERPEWYTSGPLFEGWRIKVPTLILSGGDQAKGASAPLAMEVLLSMLRENGVPARYVRYDREGHNYKSAAVVRHALGQMDEWLRLYARAK